MSFLPKQEGSGIPSPDNVRPISGWDNINLIHAGKNLVDENKRYSSQTSTYIGATTDEYKTYLKAGTYRFTAETNGANYYMYYRKSDKSAVAIWTPSDGEKTGVFTLEDDGWYRFNHYHSSGVDRTKIGRNWLTLGNDVSDYEEYKGQAVSFPLPDTFYGGYVDLISGELVQTLERISTSHIQFDTEQTNGVVAKIPKIDLEIFKTTSLIADRFDRSISSGPGRMVVANGQAWFIIPKDQMESYDLAGIKTWIQEYNPVFIAELQTPVVYQLPPQIIKTLRGINNIWSDAGEVEVKYWTH